MMCLIEPNFVMPNTNQSKYEKNKQHKYFGSGFHSCESSISKIAINLQFRKNAPQNYSTNNR
nr:hypothetical protein [Bacteroidota bacterium]